MFGELRPDSGTGEGADVIEFVFPLFLHNFRMLFTAFNPEFFEVLATSTGFSESIENLLEAV